MNILSTALIALSLSADAFAVAAGKGAALRRPRLREAFRVGAIFGLMEAIMPVIGWGIGYGARAQLATVGHWLAFAILAAIGVKMIWDSCQPPPAMARPRRHSWPAIIMAGIGSSIDALAIGITLALIGADIWVTAAIIGLSSFVMATTGMLVGRYAGNKLGRVAEAAGGIMLVLIGVAILLNQLSLWDWIAP